MKSGPFTLVGTSLTGKTIGIMGLGRIGFATAKRFKAFDTEIIYSSRTEKEEGKSIGAKFVTFDKLLTDSDIIIITSSFNDDTKGIFNKEAFEKMKTTAFIVNTSRGGLINQPDLIEALKVLIVTSVPLKRIVLKLYLN